jgi:ABC-type antimicrobial peptide transport system permease subunit
MIKFRTLPLILAILVYSICFWALYHDEAASDWYTLIGFPLYFYTNSEGKFEPGHRPHFGFNATNFIIDLAVVFLIIIVFNYLYSLILKRKHVR